MANLIENRRIVAFYGSSTIAGKGQAFNIISKIQRRHNNIKFINLGTGGDNAYDALQRIDSVIKCNAVNHCRHLQHY